MHVTAEPLTGRTKYRFGRVKIIGKDESMYIVGQLNNTQYLSPGQ
jgi:hypothetical protein